MYIVKKDSISWLYSCDKSSYIRFVYNQYHVYLLKCTDQNVNYQSLFLMTKMLIKCML